jgi:two-component system chemotaxis response regulator CheY
VPVLTVRKELDRSAYQDMTPGRVPEMDGQEVVKEVRKIEEEEWGIVYPKGIKIIMTTALDDPHNVVTAFKSFCDAYLVKPITEEKLIAAIREFFPDFGI